MNLEPRVFWDLTVREFWIKHDAYVRAENRAEAAMIRHALRTKRYKDQHRNSLQREANRLTRYPLKSWLR